MSLGPVAYKREEVPSHRVRGTDYLIHFLKLYIDDDPQSATAKAKSGMPRLSLTQKADAAGAKKAIMADSRPKKVGRRRKASTRRTTSKLPSRRHGVKRRKRKKSKSSSGKSKKQTTSYMPVVVLSPPQPRKNEIRDCRDCYDRNRRLDHDGRGRSPPPRRRSPSRRSRYSPPPRSPGRRRHSPTAPRRRSPMQRSPPPRRRDRRPSPPYRSPGRPPSTERHEYSDRFVSRRRGEAGASGNMYKRVPAWAMPPRDDVFSPREGHLGDKLDLLTRMLRDMKTEMKSVKSRQRKRRFRPRNPNPPAQPTIITIPGQPPPLPSSQPPAAAPAVIHSGGPNVVPYPIYIPTPGGYGGGGGGGAPRQSGSWSSWFGGGSNDPPPPPPPPPNYHQDHSRSEPDYTYFEEGGIRGMLGLEAFNDETIGWIVLIGIAGLIAVQELERQRLEWGPRDSDGGRMFGTSWDEMLYGPYATANVTEGILSFC